MHAIVTLSLALLSNESLTLDNKHATRLLKRNFTHNYKLMFSSNERTGTFYIKNHASKSRGCCNCLQHYFCFFLLEPTILLMSRAVTFSLKILPSQKIQKISLSAVLCAVNSVCSTSIDCMSWLIKRGRCRSCRVPGFTVLPRENEIGKIGHSL